MCSLNVCVASGWKPSVQLAHKPQQMRMCNTKVEVDDAVQCSLALALAQATVTRVCSARRTAPSCAQWTQANTQLIHARLNMCVSCHILQPYLKHCMLLRNVNSGYRFIESWDRADHIKRGVQPRGTFQGCAHSPRSIRRPPAAVGLTGSGGGGSGTSSSSSARSK